MTLSYVTRFIGGTVDSVHTRIFYDETVVFFKLFMYEFDDACIFRVVSNSNK